ncbi:MAG: hypothetical protein RLZZ507_2357 [Cyanobacteriota bacterium]
MNGKGYNLEVKTKAGIFDDHNILVGAVHRWDAYKFPVHYVVAIDRNTGEARVADADPMIRDAEWLRVKSQELSCGIPRYLFTPLDAWVDFIKS